MPSEIHQNNELQMAGSFVQDTGCNIFLTGKAGTGKTTFLHTLKKNTAKRVSVRTEKHKKQNLSREEKTKRMEEILISPSQLAKKTKANNQTKM